jgi:hypothetical protein
MDGRDNATSLLDNVIGPIRAKNPDATIYLATYESPALADLREVFAPCELIILDRNGSSQLETYRAALTHISKNDDFDALVVIRFDTAFKKPFDAWNLKIERDSIHFPWKEYRDHWQHHRRVGDMIHVIGKAAIPDFLNGIAMNQMAGRGDLHLMYYYLRTMHENLKFIEDGYFDSNTLFANPECDNPLYTVFNRPRLAIMDDRYGTMSTEIMAE